ncbi:amino acid adenylation domain-containing protein [Kordia jejudonensis]|uniref:amino acid adenylation domain-containing protein n=1 Tax=Kordia jejudonensis TaxID=1348245 RepID=UPI0006298AA6|nr:amino acid adenylation domain-containing protein [Kordia jejudonensis]
MNTAKTLAHIIEHWSIETPNQLAILNHKTSYTFNELEHKSNNLAQQMVAHHNIKYGDRVLVITDKASEIIVAIIAIWKAGAIYVPVDKENGVKRTEFILKNTDACLVISSQKYLDRFSEVIHVPTINYQSIAALHDKESSFKTTNNDETNAGVIIHTSGSTGMPKGVILSHKSMIQYFKAHNNLLQFDQHSRNINFGPYHFDVGIQDTFLPLLFGTGVYVYTKLLIPRLILDLVKNNDITHLICVSSVLALISGDAEMISKYRDTKLKILMTGGEVCDVKLINRWLDSVPGLIIHNGYGPTECNSLCMAHTITEADHERTKLYPIGKGFEDVKVMLMDDKNQPIHTPNTVGTLLIGGDQLMDGYWNAPDQTAKAFIHFDDEKYYITGDLAKFDADGNYYFEGRNDSEVKILGKRINLNEIRDALLSIENIDYCIADVLEFKGKKQIYAYVLVQNEIIMEGKWLADQLRTILPEYMIPKHFYITDKVIKTSSNKINEKKTKEFVKANLVTEKTA